MVKLLKFVDQTEIDRYLVVDKESNEILCYIVYNHHYQDIFPNQKWIPYYCDYDYLGDDRLSELCDFLDKLNGVKK